LNTNKHLILTTNQHFKCDTWTNLWTFK